MTKQMSELQRNKNHSAVVIDNNQRQSHCIAIPRPNFIWIQVYCPQRLYGQQLCVSMAATVEGLLLEIIGKYVNISRLRQW